MDSTTLVWVAGVVACLAAVSGHFASNALLRTLAAMEPELWHRLGEPSGQFAPPRGRHSFSPLRRDPVSAWLTRSPAWVTKNPQARRLLIVIRISVVVLVLAILTLVVARASA